jgi:hypothetical protein
MNDILKIRKAYSYQRFSSARQRDGDSLWRQYIYYSDIRTRKLCRYLVPKSQAERYKKLFEGLQMPHTPVSIERLKERNRK